MPPKKLKRGSFPNWRTLISFLVSERVEGWGAGIWQGLDSVSR